MVSCNLNKQRKFGSSSSYYGFVLMVGNEPTPILLTPDQVRVARERALAQPEDAPKIRWWHHLRRRWW